MDALTAAEFTSRQREKLATEGIAMKDGAFPIRNVTDLKNAIQSIGRADNPSEARKHIEKRARALQQKALIPTNWLTASAIEEPEEEPEEIEEIALTAAAAGLAPVVPPREWFFEPEPDTPTPITITADGRFRGHAALWGSCHTAFQGRCTQPPRSPSGYEYFHLGELMTDDGTVPVGKITMGTGHASLSASSNDAASHYDNTGMVAAFVRATDGKHGIWVCGSARSDAPAEKVQALRAAAVSGDWRRARPGGPLEMIGLLAVNVPGFPVPRTQAALAASGWEDSVEALVAAGMPLLTEEEAARHLDVLFSMIDGSLETQVLDATELAMSQTAAAKIRTVDEETVAITFD